MIALAELMSAMVLHVMHERGWSMEETVAWVKVRSYEDTKRDAVAGAAQLQRARKVGNNACDRKYNPEYRPYGQKESGERCRSTAS